MSHQRSTADAASQSNRLEPEHLASELEALLGEMLIEHERLLALTLEHRAALSQADHARIARCASEQSQASARIDSLNRKRSALLVAFRPGVSLREVIAATGQTRASRLEELGQKLRDVVVSLRREQERLRLASASLASHMQGLIQQIHRRLSHAGVYSTQGRVEAGAMVVSGLDITS